VDREISEDSDVLLFFVLDQKHAFYAFHNALL